MMRYLLTIALCLLPSVALAQLSAGRQKITNLADGVAATDAATVGQIVGGGSGITELTGCVTAGPGSGAQASAVTNACVTLPKLELIGTGLLLGNNSGGNLSPFALTAAQVKTMLAIASSDVSGLSALATNTDAAGLSGTIACNRLPAFSGGDTTSSVGTCLLTLGNTAVTPATYGSATAVGVCDVNAQGRITGCTNTAISIPATAISDSSAAGRTVLTAANAAAQRTALGLVISTDVQAQDAELQAIAGLTSAADRVPYYTGSGTAALATFTGAARTFNAAVDVAAEQAVLSLVPGTNVQAFDAELTAISSCTSSSDTLCYFTGSGTATTTGLTGAGRALLDDAAASNQRTTLGLGTVAIQDANAIAITGGSITGMSSPTATSDVATKGYVDGVSSSIQNKAQARLCSTADGTLATAFENGDTMDAVTLATNDRIVLKDQGAQTENGIYTVNASGAPTRSTDADAGSELVGATIQCSAGTANNGRVLSQTTPSPITIGVSNIVFVNYLSLGGAALAANNLSDLASASTARTNLGLGSLATQSGTFSGTSSGTNTGDQTITLTGNVTGSGTGSFAATIGAAQVTHAMHANAGALSVAGRSANSAGVPADISATAASGAVMRESGSTIGFGTVSTAGIGDSQVTLAKIANQNAATILGNNTGGAAAPIALTSAQVRTLMGLPTLTTKGDLYTFSTVEARLGVGADGLCLKALNSAGTGLEWGTCAAGGSGLTHSEVMGRMALGGF